MYKIVYSLSLTINRKMSVDKFGRYSNNQNKAIKRNIVKVIGFNIEKDGDINLQKKRIKNLGKPIHEDDAVTKSFISSEIQRVYQELLTAVEKLKKELLAEIANLHNFNDALKNNLNNRLIRIEDIVFESIKGVIAIKTPEVVFHNENK